MSKETAEDRELRAELEGIGLAEGGPMVGSIPERWLSQPRFRCINLPRIQPLHRPPPLAPALRLLRPAGPADVPRGPQRTAVRARTRHRTAATIDSTGSRELLERRHSVTNGGLMVSRA